MGCQRIRDAGRAPAIVLALAALVAAPGLVGCTIMEQRKDIDATQGRIATKTGVLENEEDTQAVVAHQRDQLLADLHDREMSTAQLNARLDALIKANDQARVDTEQQRRQRDTLARRLVQIRKQAQPPPPTPSQTPDDRARAEAAVRAQTRRNLEQLLTNSSTSP